MVVEFGQLLSVGYCKLELVVHRAAKFFFRLLRQVMQFKLALNYIVCVGLELTVQPPRLDCLL